MKARDVSEAESSRSDGRNQTASRFSSRESRREFEAVVRSLSGPDNQTLQTDLALGYAIGAAMQR